MFEMSIKYNKNRFKYVGDGGRSEDLRTGRKMDPFVCDGASRRDVS